MNCYPADGRALSYFIKKCAAFHYPSFLQQGKTAADKCWLKAAASGLGIGTSAASQKNSATLATLAVKIFSQTIT